MGLTHVEAIIASPGNPRKTAKLTFLVDSGTVYSVVPKTVLRRLGVKPHSKRTLTLADGSRITRQVGDVVFKFNGQQGASPVIFGEKGDSILLGTVSLEALGFILDPIRRELRPLPPVLAEGYRAMAEETRDTAERRLPAFREIFKLRDLRWAAGLQLLQALERQPGALSQAEADRIATEAKHRTRELSFSRRAERRVRFERPCSTSATRTSVESETP